MSGLYVCTFFASDCPSIQVSNVRNTVYISGVYGMGDSVEGATQHAFTQLKGNGQLLCS